jgi:hypothetical protein
MRPKLTRREPIEAADGFDQLRAPPGPSRRQGCARLQRPAPGPSRGDRRLQAVASRRPGAPVGSCLATVGSQVAGHMRHLSA